MTNEQKYQCQLPVLGRWWWILILLAELKMERNAARRGAFFGKVLETFSKNHIFYNCFNLVSICIYWVILARLERFERPTLGSVDRCSIQLSYRRRSNICGEGGIRTLDTVRYTRLAGVRLRPTRPPPLSDVGPEPAEEQGFEPRVPFDTTVFKTAAFDHSATPPDFQRPLSNLTRARIYPPLHRVVKK